MRKTLLLLVLCMIPFAGASAQMEIKTDTLSLTVGDFHSNELSGKNYRRYDRTITNKTREDYVTWVSRVQFDPKDRSSIKRSLIFLTNTGDINFYELASQCVAKDFFRKDALLDLFVRRLKPGESFKYSVITTEGKSPDPLFERVVLLPMKVIDQIAGPYYFNENMFDDREQLIIVL